MPHTIYLPALVEAQTIGAAVAQILHNGPLAEPLSNSIRPLSIEDLAQGFLSHRAQGHDGVAIEAAGYDRSIHQDSALIAQTVAGPAAALRWPGGIGPLEARGELQGKIGPEHNSGLLARVNVERGRKGQNPFKRPQDSVVQIGLGRVPAACVPEPELDPQPALVRCPRGEVPDRDEEGVDVEVREAVRQAVEGHADLPQGRPSE